MKISGPFHKPAESISRGLVYWPIASLAYASVPFIFHLSWRGSLFICLLILWRVYLEFRRLNLPSSWITAPLVIPFLAILLAEHHTIFGEEAGTLFLIGLLSIRLLELHTVRDYMITCITCYFLVVVSLLFAQGIIMSVYLFTAILLVTVSLIHLHMGSNLRASFRPALRLGMKIVVPALPLALFAFVFFPRFQGKLTLEYHSIKIGVQDSLEAGNIAQMKKDNRLAFRVEFANDQCPVSGELYWRCFVLNTTDGWRWWNGSKNRQMTGFKERPGLKYTQNITLTPQVQRWMVALDYPITIPTGALMCEGQILKNNLYGASKRQYTVVSQPEQRPQDLSPETQRRCLMLPRTLSPLVKRLVGRWKTKQKPPEALATEALRFFRDHQFIYTLDPEPVEGQDALVDFLFRQRAGFCEHYATAFAILMRTAGVPARIVTGYMGGEYNPYGRFYAIRQDHAHAWCEIWIQNKGWVRMDPTAVLAVKNPTPKALLHAAQQGMSVEGQASSLPSPRPSLWRQPAWWTKLSRAPRLWWELAEIQWNRWVVGYDRHSQEKLFKHLGMTQFRWLAVLAAALGGTAVSGALAAAWLKRQGKKADHLRRSYETFCSNLAAAGVKRKKWEGPCDFTRRAALAFPLQAEQIRRIGLQYTRLCYGTSPTEKALVKELTARIKKLGIPKAPVN
ncbi:MAG: DUF3488 and transglutaminase-like domain-containing protein [Verrucomicrobiae bacterium]|nr:DUF3488 and transglutaminase-like domain-containing protein [Verrucomicrobiae bacterium]